MSISEEVARRVMEARGGCLVKDWATEARENTHVALALATADAIMPLIEAHAAAREAAAVERCAKVAEAEAEANAQARVDRADDELAFEFRGLGRVLAAAIRQINMKGE